MKITKTASEFLHFFGEKSIHGIEIAYHAMAKTAEPRRDFSRPCLRGAAGVLSAERSRFSGILFLYPVEIFYRLKWRLC